MAINGLIYIGTQWKGFFTHFNLWMLMLLIIYTYRKIYINLYIFFNIYIFETTLLSQIYIYIYNIHAYKIFLFMECQVLCIRNLMKTKWYILLYLYFTIIIRLKIYNKIIRLNNKHSTNMKTNTIIQTSH